MQICAKIGFSDVFFFVFFLDSCSFWFMYDYEECIGAGTVGASVY